MADFLISMPSVSLRSVSSLRSVAFRDCVSGQAACTREGNAREFVGERDGNKLEGLGLYQLAALTTSSLRKERLPNFDTRPSRSFPPEERWSGVKPSQAANLRGPRSRRYPAHWQ
jgi:hypothetical protein